MPENTTPDRDLTVLEVIHPTTGEVLDLRGASPAELTIGLENLDELLGRLADFRRALELELVRRVDATGRRTATVGGVKLEVNAPMVEAYEVRDVEAEVRPLVEAGTVANETLEALVIYPPRPPLPPPRVDRRVLNSLKASDNDELVRALARARRRTSARRTVKVLERPVDATAEDA